MESKSKSIRLGNTSNIGYGWKLAVTIAHPGHARQSPSVGATTIANLQCIKLGLELLDRAVSNLEIFVETIALRDKLLLSI